MKIPLRLKVFAPWLLTVLAICLVIAAALALLGHLGVKSNAPLTDALAKLEARAGRLEAAGLAYEIALFKAADRPTPLDSEDRLPSIDPLAHQSGALVLAMRGRLQVFMVALSGAQPTEISQLEAGQRACEILVAQDNRLAAALESLEVQSRAVSDSLELPFARLRLQLLAAEAVEHGVCKGFSKGDLARVRLELVKP